MNKEFRNSCQFVKFVSHLLLSVFICVHPWLKIFARVHRLISYAFIVVAYFVSMFGTSHAGNFPARK